MSSRRGYVKYPFRGLGLLQIELKKSTFTKNLVET